MPSVKDWNTHNSISTLQNMTIALRWLHRDNVVIRRRPGKRADTTVEALYLSFQTCPKAILKTWVFRPRKHITQSQRALRRDMRPPE